MLVFLSKLTMMMMMMMMMTVKMKLPFWIGFLASMKSWSPNTIRLSFFILLIDVTFHNLRSRLISCAAAVDSGLLRLTQVVQ